MRKHSLEIDQKIILMRQNGTPRQQIAEELGIPLSKVKTVLNKSGTKISPEISQKNAQEAKNKKNPNWLSDMQARAHAPEARAKRNKSNAETYKNPELKQLKSETSRKWWDSLSQQDKNAYLQRRQKAIDASLDMARYALRSVPDANPETPLASFQSKLEEIASQLGGKVLGQYTRSKSKMLFSCQKGHEFEAIPNTVFLGHWCPNCAFVGPSKGQLELYEYVKRLAPDAILNDKVALKLHARKASELDIYVPSARLGIEFNGLFWHSNYHGSKNGRHLAKFKACQNARISLLAVFEDEWKNKKELVQAMIRQRLGLFNGVKLNARSLELKKLNKNREFDWFFEQFHLDGHTQASFAYGLFSQDKLVCCASFRTNFNGELEIARLATDYNYLVRGGAGRLISQIKEPLVSFSNNRLSSGNVYKNLGFELIQENSSSYWYTDGNTRVWRFKCRRINIPEVLSVYPTEEAQCMAGIQSQAIFGDNRPLYRIEDYGHLKWQTKQAIKRSPEADLIKII